MLNNPFLIKAGEVVRQTSLAMLFAGPFAIAVAAVSLVRAGQYFGTSAEVTAARNAPMFISYSMVMLVPAILLLIVEGVEYARSKGGNKLRLAGHISSLLCIAATFVFSFGIVPKMQDLYVKAPSVRDAMRDFKALHHTSELVFGSVMFFAFGSIVFAVCARKSEISS